jgi:aminoglycoside phosphotransferase (APT) family kinase protein
MDESREAALRAALERLIPAPAARRARLEALTGGVSRRSYLVSAGSERWVLRLPTPGVAPLLDVGTEADVMRIAADAGLAPAVRGVDIGTGALLTEFRDGARSWTPEDARRQRNVERVAALLRSLHSLAARAPAFAAESIARSYLSALSAGAQAGRAELEAPAGRWADELLALARHYDGAHAPSALCHNDLVAANVLDDGRLMLVDFEYAVRGAPILDLAGLAGMNDYGAGECRELLAAYSVGANRTISMAELSKTVRMVRLMAFFWARLGALRAPSPQGYRDLAADLEAKLS